MSKYLIRHLVIVFFLLFPISCGVSEIKETAAVKAPASPKPGDCTSCHEGKEVLPKDHVDTTDMMGDACKECHESGLASLKKIPLSHIHRLAGISCKDCHEDPASAKPVSQDVCKTCHSDMKALFNATSNVGLNPHFSPHEGKILDCNKCHHQHKSSVNYCKQCHQQ